MLNFQNFSGGITSFSDTSMVFSKYPNEYYLDNVNISNNLINAHIGLNFSKSASVKLAFDIQLGVVTGLAKSIIALDSAKIADTNISTIMTKGFLGTFQLNSGKGFSNLTTQSFKEKIEVPTDQKVSTYDINGVEVKTTYPTTATKDTYSAPDALKNYLIDNKSTEISEINDAFSNLFTWTNNQVTEVPAAHGSSSDLPTRMSTIAEKINNLFGDKGNAYAHDDKGTTLDSVLSVFRGTADANNLTKFFNEAEISQIDRAAEVLIHYCVIKNKDKAICAAVHKDFPGFAFDRKSGGVITRSNVTMRITKKASGPEISPSTLFGGSNTIDSLFDFHQVQGTTVTPLTQEEFFKKITNVDSAGVDLSGVDSEHARKIFLFGNFYNNGSVSTLSRAVSISTVPNMQFGLSFANLSIRGVDIESVDLVFEAPVLAPLASLANDWLTFGVTTPSVFDIELQNQKPAEAYENISSSLISQGQDKALSEVFKCTTDSHKSLVNQQVITPFDVESGNPWITYQNFGFCFGMKFGQSIANVLTGLNFKMKYVGSNLLMGIGLSTVYQSIQIL